MLPTSTKYKEAKKKRYIKSTIEGAIQLPSGVVFAIEDDIIAKESLNFSNRCTSSGEFSLGACFVGEMNIELYIDTNRYSINGARIGLTQLFELEDGDVERIDLGLYNVSEVQRTRRSVLLKCYDDMLKFDTAVEFGGTSRAYEMYSYICTACGVVLGSTREYIEALPNSDKLFYLDSEKVKTYREALSYIARLQCAFCTIGRDGKLYIKSLADAPIVDTIEEARRISSTIYDYETYFSGIRARFLANQNFYPYEQRVSATGIMIDLGDVPILTGIEEVKHDALNQILQQLKDIRYNPCDVTMVGDASLEVGDYVRIEDANGTTEDIKALITSISWGFHNAMSITSDGKDASLENIRTDAERDIQNLQTASDIDVFSTINFTNIDRVLGEAEYKRIADIAFAPRKAGSVLFNGVVKLTMSEVGKVSVKYALNGIEYDFIHVCQMPRGEHTITLFAPIMPRENVTNRFEVFISSTEDCTIEVADFRGSIYGAGISDVSWDGNIDVSDIFSFVVRNQRPLAFVDGDAELALGVSDKTTASDVFAFSNIGKLAIDFEDSVIITIREPVFNRVTEDGDRRVTEDGDIRITD